MTIISYLHDVILWKYYQPRGPLIFYRQLVTCDLRHSSFNIFNVLVTYSTQGTSRSNACALGGDDQADRSNRAASPITTEQELTPIPFPVSGI
ncbi:hypothetical protein FKM82_017314 [Ascaphus truei]